MEGLIKVFKNNIKLCIILAVIILIGSVSVTFSIVISGFKGIGVNTTTMDIDATIGYDTNSNGAEIVSNGNMLPISDSLVTGVDVTDARVLKAKFTVTGVEDNPENTIYDIALHDIDIDCALRTEDLKWRLYKNGSLLSSGTFSPQFDTMNNNRLVLTNTQEDLTTDSSEYVFLLWISETCSDDVTNCTSVVDQNDYINKTFGASIKVELSVKTKKTLQRVTSDENSCVYTEVEIPVCNTLTYTGSSQTLVNSGTGYTLVNYVGTNIGRYVVTVKLRDGYKWSDGSTDDKLIYCEINS